MVPAVARRLIAERLVFRPARSEQALTLPLPLTQAKQSPKDIVRRFDEWYGMFLEGEPDFRVDPNCLWDRLRLWARQDGWRLLRHRQPAFRLKLLGAGREGGRSSLGGSRIL